MVNAAPAPASTGVAARAVDAVKIYGHGDTAVHALDGVTVDFAASAFTAIMGPSGSGKSTLMHCLAGLDSADSGEVHVGDASLVGMSDKQLTTLRRDRVGFVFQQFNLLPTLTAEENILLPASIAGAKADPAWIHQIITTLDLGDRLSHKPAELSGGQQQRVAVARALATQPAIVFADEPTGNLDSKTGGEILDLLERSVADYGQTLVMVTHEPRAAAIADRVLFLADGRIVDEMADPTADAVLERMKRFDTVGRRS